MSWSDALKGSLGSLIGQAEQGALPSIIQSALGAEGLQAILGKLQAGGLGEQVSSWIDQNKQNLPISTEQLQAALGNEHVQQLAQSLGLPVDKLLAAMADHLPQVASGAEPPAASDGSDEQPK